MPEPRPSTGMRFRLETAGILLGATAVLFHEYLKRHPAAAERFFGRGVFVGFRWAWDYTLGLSPVPLFHIVLVLTAGWIASRLFGRKRARREGRPLPGWTPSLLRRAVGLVFRLAAAAGAGIFLFYLMWGFNYARPRIEETIGLRPVPLDHRAIRAEAAVSLRDLTEARDGIPGAGPEALTNEDFPEGLENRLRESLSEVIRSLGYPAPGRPRVRRFRPGAWPMRFFISGIYVPFLGEGYVAGALTPPEIPFAMAHEMTHGFGFTEEGTANFLAWLACEGSGDAAIRYSGRLAYWGYVSSELRRIAPEEFRTMVERLPDGARADLQALYRNWRRFRGPLSSMARDVNDRYLKAQGVREGVRSYDRMVTLVRAWRIRPPD